MDLVKTTRNVTKVFLSRIRIPYLYEICRFYVNTYNNDMDCYFYTNGEYRLAKILLPRCEVVFDIGAATGQWSKMALTVNKNIQLHAFEPSIERYNSILATGLPLIANAFALGKQKEQLTLYHGTVGGSNSLHPSIDSIQCQRKEVVQVTTIDEYCQENHIDRINFIKIDVEGHELDVLKGAMHMLKLGKSQ